MSNANPTCQVNRRIQLEVATNFDPALVGAIAIDDPDRLVTTLYGKLNADVVGGGRHSLVLPKLSLDELGRYIELCHRHDRRFNYLLNAVCLENLDVNPRHHKKILHLLSTLRELRVDAVTVSSPLLCEIVKTHLPEFEVVVGVHARVFSLQQVKYWESLGADVITLAPRACRNFPHLRLLLGHTRQTGTGLRLIANNLCLRECPFALHHSLALCHGSRKDGNPLLVDYSLLSCTQRKVTSPVLLISSDWIRPEDAAYYERLCESVDSYRLSLKLVERCRSTEFLTRVVRAYTAGQYIGNLADLLNWPTQGSTQVFHLKDVLLHLVTSGYNREAMRKLPDVLHVPPVCIDNQGLDGFLEKFWTSYDCDQWGCDDRAWAADTHALSSANGACGYCRQWARRVLTYDGDLWQKWLGESQWLLEQVRHGTLFDRKGRSPELSAKTPPTAQDR